MNSNALRHLFQYHFAQNRRIWDAHITALSAQDFTQKASYARRSIRGQLVHIMEVDDIWFRELRGAEPPTSFPVAEIDDRAAIRAHWDNVEKSMGDYLAALNDDMLFLQPITEPDEDRNLFAWQVLLHVINHGTDHRAQLLRSLNEIGIDTTCQDYIFYVYKNPVDDTSV